jgi:hypothetical protein
VHSKLKEGGWGKIPWERAFGLRGSEKEIAGKGGARREELD